MQDCSERLQIAAELPLVQLVCADVTTRVHRLHSIGQALLWSSMRASGVWTYAIVLFTFCALSNASPERWRPPTAACRPGKFQLLFNLARVDVSRCCNLAHGAESEGGALVMQHHVPLPRTRQMFCPLVPTIRVLSSVGQWSQSAVLTGAVGRAAARPLPLRQHRYLCF